MKQIRELGYMELVISRAHDNFSGALHVVSIFHIEGLINVDNLIKSLQILYIQHPLLKAKINNTPGKSLFEVDESVHKFEDIPIIVKARRNDAHWEDVMGAELKHPLQINKSLWRATILHESNTTQSQCELIFSFHHAISDVISTAYFIKDMLIYYDNLQNSKLNEKINQPTLPLLPPIEQLLEKSTTWQQHLGNLSKYDFTAATLCNFEEKASLKERQPKAIFKQLEEEQVQLIQEHCKENGVTVGAALNAAMLLSAQKLYGKNLNILLPIAVNLRPYCKEKLENNHFGFYAGLVPMIYKDINENSNFWSLAYLYQNNLTTMINDFALLPKEFDINILEAMHHVEARNTKEDHSFNSGFAVISNCGKLDIPLEYGSVRLKSFNSFASNLLSTWGVILTISTIQSKMFLSFNYASPLLGEKQALFLADTFMSTLLRNCSNELVKHRKNTLPTSFFCSQHPIPTPQYGGNSIEERDDMDIHQFSPQ